MEQELTWWFDNTVMTRAYGKISNLNKIAAFDFDGCLVNKSFADKSLCSLTFEIIPNIMKELHNKGYMIFIISNQGDIGRATNSKENVTKCIQQRFDTFVKQCDISCIIFASTMNDEFRKPNIGMWSIITRLFPAIDMDASFYVGDAAGRPNDHSDCDKLFAANIGIRFFTESQFFRDRMYLAYVQIAENEDQALRRAISFTFPTYQELILMVGYPGSGKTTFTTNLFADNYVVIHGDDYKSDKKKMYNAMMNELNKGKSVVIDATHSTIESRAYYLNAVNSLGIKARAVHITTDFNKSVQRNNNRQDSKKVPIIAMYKYRKSFELPTVEEGFVEVISV